MSNNSKIRYSGGHYCCVTGCQSRQGRDDVKFFNFPKRNPEQFNLWIRAVKRENFHPNRNTVICQEHFVTGKPGNRRDSPDYYPTVFPTLHCKAKTEADLARFERAKKRKLDAAGNETVCEYKGPPAEAELVQDDPVGEVDEDVGEDENDSTVWNDKETQTPHKLTKDVAVVTDPNTNSHIVADQVLQSEEVCKSMCGVAMWFFKMTLEQVDDALRARVLTKEDQLVLYFMKLNQSLEFTVLGTIFKCNERTASSIFANVLDAHYEIASKLTWWLPKEKIKATMPSSFKLHYPDCRAIIDASEIKITCPNTVEARNLTYSHYKANFTAKFLVAIAPSGFITFISKAYGGRMTDTNLTNDSGLLDLLEPQDVILADKGFPSIEEDVLNRGAFLVMPTFTSGGRQFSEQENKHSYKVASVRIHVERAIQRLKTFKILNFVEQPMFKHLDKILVVLAYCVNHFGPLIKEKK